MTDNTTMLQKIAGLGNTLSPKQLLLAQYLEDHYTDLAYTTMTELSRLVGVSETTVVRFVYNLGYKGFPDFMTALRAELASKKENPLMREFTIQQGLYEFPKDICRAVFSMEMQVMSETVAGIDDDDFQRAVSAIYNANEVVIVGSGANTCCTHALLFALQVLKSHVYAVEKLGLSEDSYIRSLGPTAICIAFTTPRYPVETQKIVKFIHGRNIPIIGISNSLLAPIVPYSSIFFQIPEKYVTYIDSNASYMALIHALTFGVYQKDKVQAKKQIEAYDAFVRETNYYVNGDVALVELGENCKQGK